MEYFLITITTPSLHTEEYVVPARNYDVACALAEVINLRTMGQGFMVDYLYTEATDA